MRWQVLGASLLLPMLIACGTPQLRLERDWNEILPVEKSAVQGIIIDNRLYYTNFAFGGSRQLSSIVAGFDLDARKELWQIERKPRTPLASDGERLFVADNRRVEAIALTDGASLWHSPAVSADDVYDNDELLSKDGWVFYEDNQSYASKLYALEARTGTLAWSVTLGAAMDRFVPHIPPFTGEQYRSMSYDRGQLYVREAVDIEDRSRFRYKLVSLDAANGHTLWEFPFETAATQGDASVGASLAAYSDEAVYFGTRDSVSYALQRQTGTVLWERQVGLEQPVYVDGEIIGVSGYLTVAALDARDGSVKWRVGARDDDGIGALSPFVFSNESLFFYSGGPDGGQISIVDLKTGERVFVLRLDSPSACSTTPASMGASGDHLYLVTQNCLSTFELSR